MLGTITVTTTKTATGDYVSSAEDESGTKLAAATSADLESAAFEMGFSSKAQHSNYSKVYTGFVMEWIINGDESEDAVRLHALYNKKAWW
jgi:hypothetical protein